MITANVKTNFSNLPRFFNFYWVVDSSAHEKLELTFLIAKELKTLELYKMFFEFLTQYDQQFWRMIGGDVFSVIIDPREKGDLIEQFDDKYLSLILLLANSSLTLAQGFHHKAYLYYHQHGRSHIRYERLTNSLKNSENLLSDLTRKNLQFEEIYPKYDSNFHRKTVALSDGTITNSECNSTRNTILDVRSIRSLNHVLAPSRHTKKTYNQGISPVIRLPSTCPRTV